MTNDLTQGNIFKVILRFSLPFIISNFLQTFYGLADLFITGQFNGAGAITAVSVGSQITHMLTVVIVGLSTGGSVAISVAVGAGDKKGQSRAIGNTIRIFAVFSVILTVVLLVFTDGILNLLSVPPEAYLSAKAYVTVCFAGVPFITAYNVASGIFRGMGDSKTPMYFVAIAGIINVILDYILIGPFSMGAAGAAYATVISQALSVVLAVVFLLKMKNSVKLSKEDLKTDRVVTGKILKTGVPVALQEGFIQVSFLVITVIANRRGVDTAAAVGIVEKIISFLFLIPSAMLSTTSMITAQSIGAGKHERGRQALKCCCLICFFSGMVFFVLAQFFGAQIVGIFAKDEAEVIRLGAQYFSSYSVDCAIAGIHFCFSGYFNAYQKSWITFLHNAASIILVRIPGSYFAAVHFPETLFPMGLAAPLGSLLSVIICVIFYCKMEKSIRGRFCD